MSHARAPAPCITPVMGPTEHFGTSVLCPGFVATQIFSSERNRPDQLGGPGASSFGGGSAGSADTEQAAALQAMLANILDPTVIGDMVLHAIREDIFYILSHPEFKEMLADRALELGSSFDRWQAWRVQNGV